MVALLMLALVVVETSLALVSAKLVRSEGAQTRIAYTMLGILPAWALNLQWKGGPDVDQMIGKNGFSWPVATGILIMVFGVIAHVAFE